MFGCGATCIDVLANVSCALPLRMRMAVLFIGRRYCDADDTFSLKFFGKCIHALHSSAGRLSGAVCEEVDGLVRGLAGKRGVANVGRLAIEWGPGGSASDE